MGLAICGRKWIFFVGLIFVIDVINLTSGEVCSNFKTCAGCIANRYACVWCSAEQHDGPRCVSEKAYNTNVTWCTDPVENPKTEQKVVQFNETVQFMPQHIKLNVRVGDPARFNISYKPAKDYPLDIYYLIDNSYTMKKHTDKIGDQAQEIYDTLLNLTNNVRFGMGSFVDKRALPYANPYNPKPAYSFKNHISLTDNITRFGETVKNLKYVGNYDDLEGGLDALMQVMMCFHEIRWRNESRRMIILSTDASYHSAGDGKIVGAYKHNPMECHLDDDGSYRLNSSLLYDYPSVSQINKAAKDRQFTIIFAALQQVKEVYEALADNIKGAKYVELSLNSDIVDLIKNEYMHLTQNLKISLETSLPPHIKLRLDPPCSVGKPCSVKHREPRNISVVLKVTQCSNDKHHTIKLGPLDLPERLLIDVDVHCACNCEKDTKLNSSKCTELGEYQCGICNCNKGRFGAECECVGDLSLETAMEGCKGNKNDECSGNGNCSCGKCTCENGFSGPLCQFSKFSCPYYEGQPCAGHGHCAGDNNCACDANWSGKDCSCTLDTNTCIAPKSNKNCSDNGECKCGQCNCKNKYTGAYCEYCDGCAEARCIELGDFVECYYNMIETDTTQIGLCKEKFKITDSYNITLHSRIEMNKQEWRDAHRCKKVLLDGCFIVFKYIDKDDGGTTLLIQKEKEEPTKANVWVAVGICIGTILLIGLLTAVAWKVLVDMHDAREYEKFSKKAVADGFQVSNNPLYQSPALKFENPAYKSK